MEKKQIAMVIYLFGICIGLASMTAILASDANPSSSSSSKKQYSPIQLVKLSDEEKKFVCFSNNDCGHGKCILERDIYGNSLNISHCECDNEYATRDDNEPCEYKQRSGLVALLLAIFVGALGVPFFYLAVGSCAYICYGLLMLFTCGGCCVGYLVVVILIAVGTLPDGNGVELCCL